MPNISDQELDKLFQEAGQGMRPEFDPNDWEDLAKRLDREERRAMARRASGYGLAVLLLISSAAWLTESSATSRPQLAQTQSLSAQKAETGSNTQHRTLSTDTTTTSSLPETQTTTAPTVATTTSTAKKQNITPTQQDNTNSSAATTSAQQTDAIQKNAAVIDNRKAGTTTSAKAQASATAKKPVTTAPLDQQPLASASTVPHTNAKQRHRAAQTSRRNGEADKNTAAGSVITPNTQTESSKVSGARQTNSPVDNKGIATIQQHTGHQQPTGKETTGEVQQSEHNAPTATQANTPASSAKTAGNASTANATALPQQSGSTVDSQGNKAALATTQSTTSQQQNKKGADRSAESTNDSHDSLALNESKATTSGAGRQPGNNTAAVTTEQPGKPATGSEAQQQGKAYANNDGNAQQNANGVDTVASVAGNRAAVRSNEQTGAIKNTGALVIDKTQPQNVSSKGLAPNKGEKLVSENSKGSPASSQNTTDKGVASNNTGQPGSENNNGTLTADPKQSQNTIDKGLAQNESSQPADAKTSGTTATADSVTTPKDTVALAGTKAATDTTDDKSAEEEKKKSKTPAKWFIKLPVSPDFSSIDYGKPGKSGVNIGLMAEFMPTKHWSVSLGAIWSKKIYSWDSPDKTYGGNGWSVKASYLDGDCRVLDIPLNITYYLRPEARTNFFITAGASSYIMLKEMYTYTVWANQQEYQYDEKYVRKNNNLFSMLNLSIGLQHRLSNRFQVQAEPFLKAPISGVGQGKVNLVSMGAFFTLKYQLNK